MNDAYTISECFVTAKCCAKEEVRFRITRLVLQNPKSDSFQLHCSHGDVGGRYPGHAGDLIRGAPW